MLCAERGNSEAVYAAGEKKQDRNAVETGWSSVLYL